MTADGPRVLVHLRRSISGSLRLPREAYWKGTSQAVDEVVETNLKRGERRDELEFTPFHRKRILKQIARLYFKTLGSISPSIHRVL